MWVRGGGSGSVVIGRDEEEGGVALLVAGTRRKVWQRHWQGEDLEGGSNEEGVAVALARGRVWM